MRFCIYHLLAMCILGVVFGCGKATKLKISDDLDIHSESESIHKENRVYTSTSSLPAPSHKSHEKSQENSEKHRISLAENDLAKDVSESRALIATHPHKDSNNHHEVSANFDAFYHHKLAMMNPMVRFTATCEDIKDVLSIIREDHLNFAESVTFQGLDHQSMDQAFMVKMMKSFLQVLDEEKIYFSSEDVESISERYSVMLSKLKNRTKCIAINEVNEVYAAFQAKIKERSDELKALVFADHDFQKEEYIVSRRYRDYVSESQMSDRMRRFVKHKFVLAKKRFPEFTYEKLQNFVFHDLQNDQKRQVNLEEGERNFYFLLSLSNSLDYYSVFVNGYTIKLYNKRDSYDHRFGVDFQVKKSEFDEYFEVTDVPKESSKNHGKLAVGDRIVGIYDNTIGHGWVDLDVEKNPWIQHLFYDLASGFIGSELRLLVSRFSEQDGVLGMPFEVVLERNALAYKREKINKDVKSLVHTFPSVINNQNVRVGVIMIPDFHLDFAVEQDALVFGNWGSDVQIAVALKELSEKSKSVDALVLDLRNVKWNFEYKEAANFISMLHALDTFLAAENFGYVKVRGEDRYPFVGQLFDDQKFQAVYKTEKEAEQEDTAASVEAPTPTKEDTSRVELLEGEHSLNPSAEEQVSVSEASEEVEVAGDTSEAKEDTLEQKAVEGQSTEGEQEVVVAEEEKEEQEAAETLQNEGVSSQTDISNLDEWENHKEYMTSQNLHIRSLQYKSFKPNYYEHVFQDMVSTLSDPLEKQLGASLQPREIPIVVLVNYKTGGMGEMFVQHLLAHDRVVVVGSDRTFGNSLGSQLVGAQSGSLLSTTVREFYGADGKSLRGVGVESDIVIPWPEDVYGKESSRIDTSFNSELKDMDDSWNLGFRDENILNTLKSLSQNRIMNSEYLGSAQQYVNLLQERENVAPLGGQLLAFGEEHLGVSEDLQEFMDSYKEDLLEQKAFYKTFFSGVEMVADASLTQEALSLDPVLKEAMAIASDYYVLCRGITSRRYTQDQQSDDDISFAQDSESKQEALQSGSAPLRQGCGYMADDMPKSENPSSSSSSQEGE